MHAAVWANIALSPSRRHTPLLRLTRTLGRMKPPIVAFTIVAIAVAALPIVLLITGQRLLVHETKINPGDHYVVEEYGNLGQATQSSLVCRYFTGRSILTTVFWYSSNSVLGKDQCPFLTN